MNIRTKSSLSRASVLVATYQGDGGKCSTMPSPARLLGDTHHVAGGKESPWKPSPTPAVLMYTEKSLEANFSKASFAELLEHSYEPG